MGWNIHGHSWAADMLQQHIAGGNMRHAYLFSGPDGVGRRTLALRFAQAVNCTQPPAPGEACGVCQACKQIERMQHTDLIVAESEADSSVLKVDQVRDLQHFLSLAPYEGKFRVALLLNFEEANANAQNALLKTLEEPNPRVLLLVTTNDPKNLLQTITSRCELLRLRPMKVDELAGILEKEEDLEPDQAKLIAHISGGRVGYAKRLTSDAELLERRKQWMDDLLMLLPAGTVERFRYSLELTRGKNKRKNRPQAKEELSEGLVYWLSFWRDVLLESTDKGGRITNIDFSDEIKKIARAADSGTAVKAVGGLEHTFIRMQSANLTLMLDNILLDWPQIN
jgi:DNA polymerase-3 subunit delta'